MIRTLLIDNYDSFTFNLYQYLSEVNGCPPFVVPNDWDEFTPEELSRFDNIVISPGPGTPEKSGDFGICSVVIRDATVPVLGICLGHQGIAYVHGGSVDHAPEPMHGRPSQIWHSEQGLFDGIPSPFRAIRYHSLAVSEVPPILEVTARSEDGIVMGLQHRERPQWGVQFHPESIETEYSLQLLRNFARLTQRAETSERRVNIPTQSNSLTPRSRESEQAKTEYDVHVDTLPLHCGDEQLFSAIFADEVNSIWLDGNQPENAASRFSIMGSPTGPNASIATSDTSAGTVTVTGADGHAQTFERGFFDWLKSAMESVDVETPSLPFEFALGWAGYLGYELKSEVGSPNQHQSAIPDAWVMFLDRALVVDHLTNTIYLLGLAQRGSRGDDCREWFERTKEQIASCKVAARLPEEPSEVELWARHSHADYLGLIREAKQNIIDGESYEVCLTNMLSGESSLKPLDTYLRLREQNPAPFGAFLRSPQVQVLSTSPERFVSISGDRHVESKPIKGTRPRGNTEAEDVQIRSELQNAEKDRAENLMIVDLVRHDLSRTARLGSVRVERLFDVESYATVHQLVSTICAELDPNVDPVTCVKAAFPPGSMTGAPKLRTMEIIDKLEGGARGVYSGAIGYFSLSGAVDLSVVIRTLVLSRGEIQYGVGGAIISLSDEQAEYDETVVKARPLLHVLRDTPFPEGLDPANPTGEAL
ncbi:aminodeoxychorismate synthase component I [Propioniciclava flava]|uniref:aminodeoxychorismate synthase component I n=1 Tax=Propioniciclava flava TaxID=2072026 RepID=UPI0019D5CB2D|nr:aminodeoxychorismate synthase component I [Propioniciclava flava]